MSAEESNMHETFVNKIRRCPNVFFSEKEEERRGILFIVIIIIIIICWRHFTLSLSFLQNTFFFDCLAVKGMISYETCSGVIILLLTLWWGTRVDDVLSFDDILWAVWKEHLFWLPVSESEGRAQLPSQEAFWLEWVCSHYNVFMTWRRGIKSRKNH